MTYNFESEVAKALEKLLRTEANYDVIINVGEGLCFKEFHVHSNFLRCRSDYFDLAFSAEDIEKQDEKYVIDKPNITPQAFDTIIKYLYTGKIDITRKTGVELLDIMIASDDLKLNQLTKLSENFLLENYQQYLRVDSVKILQIIYDHHQTFNNLRRFCFEMICFEPEILFNSTDFTNLPDPLLEIILKRDDLNLAEIEIWENLIKWGLAQENTFDENVIQWHQEDFNNFERILRNFIPLIRFYNISSSDYINKVKPYEKILPKELQEEIYKFHMIPEYKPTINVHTPRYSTSANVESAIVNQKHIALIASWIDKKTKNSRYIKVVPYEFKRILRGNYHGFDPDIFHRMCDNKGASVVFIKIKNSNQIVGGYNPLDWNCSGEDWKRTNDSFIFSFNDYRDIKTGEIGRVTSEYYAIKSDPNRGPVFGIELAISNKMGFSSFPIYYAKVNIPTNFEIENYEVFQVKRKPINSIKGSFVINTLKSFFLKS